MAPSDKTTKTGEATPASRAKEISGQFAKGKSRSDNNGVASADPRVFSGKDEGDATFPIDAEDPGVAKRK
ncbi:hypothetical protein [Rhizobium sp. EC-SD404]|uniref:hypothetical protein n=1 Tax=Rhizobium sp. EC-SD404 TaxID=2038389 RepID=UPI0012558EAC|nr:hypothetical protein [Rhizobium sp. EC-SD404]VVT25690.1 conserved hypothetical protein [Rhizobium sp. EC-SD404]